MSFNLWIHEPNIASLRKLMERCVKFGDFTLASGKKSDFYFDGRGVTLSAAGAQEIGGLLAASIQVYDPTITHVGGPAVGAIPMAMAASLTGPQFGLDHLDTFFVRKEAKGHGTKQLIEGALSPDSKVLVVEDVATTGGSVLRAIEQIRETGAVVVACVVLLDREEGARAAFDAAGVPFHAIFRKSDFLPNDAAHAD